MPLYTEVAVVEVGHRTLYVVGREAGKEAEAPRVEADDGNLFVAHAAGHVEEGAVAAHAHNVVGCELVVGDDFALGHVNLQVVCEELMERFGYSQFGLPLCANGEKLLHGSTLALLMNIAKEGKLQPFSHI